MLPRVEKCFALLGRRLHAKNKQKVLIVQIERPKFFIQDDAFSQKILLSLTCIQTPISHYRCSKSKGFHLAPYEFLDGYIFNVKKI